METVPSNLVEIMESKETSTETEPPKPEAKKSKPKPAAKAKPNKKKAKDRKSTRQRATHSAEGRKNSTLKSKGPRGGWSYPANKKALVIWISPALKTAAAKFAKSKGQPQAELYREAIAKACGFKGETAHG